MIFHFSMFYYTLYMFWKKIIIYEILFPPFITSQVHIIFFSFHSLIQNTFLYSPCTFKCIYFYIYICTQSAPHWMALVETYSKISRSAIKYQAPYVAFTTTIACVINL